MTGLCSLMIQAARRGAVYLGRRHLHFESSGAEGGLAWFSDRRASRRGLAFMILLIAAIMSCRPRQPGQRAIQFGEPVRKIPGAVAAMALADDGAVWLATTRGLARYGRGSLGFVDAHTSPLPNSAVKDVALDRHGVLWLLTEGEHLVALSPATMTWTLHVENYAGHLKTAANGSVFILSHGKAFEAQRPGVVVDQGLPSSFGPVRTIEATPDGALWCVLPRGLMEIVGAEIRDRAALLQALPPAARTFADLAWLAASETLVALTSEGAVMLHPKGGGSAAKLLPWPDKAVPMRFAARHAQEVLAVADGVDHAWSITENGVRVVRLPDFHTFTSGARASDGAYHWSTDAALVCVFRGAVTDSIARMSSFEERDVEALHSPWRVQPYLKLMDRPSEFVPFSELVRDPRQYRNRKVRTIVKYKSPEEHSVFGDPEGTAEAAVDFSLLPRAADHAGPVLLAFADGALLEFHGFVDYGEGSFGQRVPVALAPVALYPLDDPGAARRMEEKLRHWNEDERRRAFRIRSSTTVETRASGSWVNLIEHDLPPAPHAEQALGVVDATWIDGRPALLVRLPSSQTDFTEVWTEQPDGRWMMGEDASIASLLVPTHDGFALLIGGRLAPVQFVHRSRGIVNHLPSIGHDRPRRVRETPAPVAAFTSGDTMTVFVVDPTRESEETLVRVRSADGGRSWSTPEALAAPVPRHSSGSFQTFDGSGRAPKLLWIPRAAHPPRLLDFDTSVPAVEEVRLHGERPDLIRWMSGFGVRGQTSWLWYAAESQLRLSVSADAGRTWRRVAVFGDHVSGERRFGGCVGSRRLYTSVLAAVQGRTYPQRWLEELLVSDDDGLTWKEVAPVQEVLGASLLCDPRVGRVLHVQSVVASGDPAIEILRVRDLTP